AARNVGFAAMDLATIAGMFPGRLDEGVGHAIKGWMQQVGAWPASPMTLLREQVITLRALLAGVTVTVDGRYVKLDGVRIEAPPAVAQLSYAGVRGPRPVALAGEIAAGTALAEPITPEHLRTSLKLHGAGADRRVVTYAVAAGDDDVARARELVRPGLEFIGEPDWAVHIDPLPYAEDFRRLRAQCATREEFTRRLPDEWVDQLAIAGPPDRSEEHTSELQSRENLVCRLLREKKK